MTAVALLRGVNVVGRHRIPMSVLTDLCRELGACGVVTWLQSGNAVFRLGRSELTAFGPRLAGAIERTLGFRPEVMTRTAGELAAAAAANPFAARSGLDPARLAVIFLSRQPSREARARVAALSCATEEVSMGRREVYVYFHNGFARATVTSATIEKAAGRPGTARNWNTVRKLVELTREPA